VGTYSETSNTRPLNTPRAYLLDDGDFTLIDAFGADNTQIGRINDRGELVGAYFDAGGPTLGFLRDRRGVFTTIEVPGAEQTGAVGINNRGQIVGAYVDAGGTDPEFLCEDEGSTSPSTSLAPRMTPPPGSGMGEASSLDSPHVTVSIRRRSQAPAHTRSLPAPSISCGVISSWCHAGFEKWQACQQFTGCQLLAGTVEKGVLRAWPEP
jgi:hypothetical protein